MTDQPKFAGFALVQILGHQQVAGYVQAEAFGHVCLFHVTLDAGEPVDVTLPGDGFVNGQWLLAGSRIRRQGLAVDRYVGAGSVYQLTPMTEAEVRRFQPTVDEILEAITQAPARLGAGEAVADAVLDDDDDDETEPF